MDGFGLTAGGFGQAFGGAAGGRGQRVSVAGRVERIEQRPQRRRLARPRPAGQDGQLVGQGSGNGLSLLGG